MNIRLNGETDRALPGPHQPAGSGALVQYRTASAMVGPRILALGVIAGMRCDPSRFFFDGGLCQE